MTYMTWRFWMRRYGLAVAIITRIDSQIEVKGLSTTEWVLVA